LSFSFLSFFLSFSNFHSFSFCFEFIFIFFPVIWAGLQTLHPFEMRTVDPYAFDSADTTAASASAAGVSSSAPASTKSTAKASASRQRKTKAAPVDIPSNQNKQQQQQQQLQHQESPHPASTSSLSLSGSLSSSLKRTLSTSLFDDEPSTKRVRASALDISSSFSDSMDADTPWFLEFSASSSSPGSLDEEPLGLCVVDFDASESMSTGLKLPRVDVMSAEIDVCGALQDSAFAWEDDGSGTIGTTISTRTLLQPASGDSIKNGREFSFDDMFCKDVF
jgi:hypothetical protein